MAEEECGYLQGVEGRHKDVQPYVEFVAVEEQRARDVLLDDHVLPVVYVIDPSCYRNAAASTEPHRLDDPKVTAFFRRLHNALGRRRVRRQNGQVRR